MSKAKIVYGVKLLGEDLFKGTKLIPHHPRGKFGIAVIELENGKITRFFPMENVQYWQEEEQLF